MARFCRRRAGEALRLVKEAKCAHHAETCFAHVFDFAPFSFLVSFGLATEEISSEFVSDFLPCVYLVMGGPRVGVLPIVFYGHVWCYSAVCLLLVFGLKLVIIFLGSS